MSAVGSVSAVGTVSAVTTQGTSGTPRGRRVKGAVGLAALVALLVVAALVAGPGRDAPPLHPRSTAPDGLKGLIDTLEALGASVDVGADVPTSAHATALVLADRFSEAERDRLQAWVRDGGVAVVTDPASPLTPRASAGATGPFGRFPASRDCDEPALAEVDRLLVTGVAYAAPPGAVGCFPRDDGHWLVAEPHGDGAIVALGGPEVFVNRALGEPGHAALAAALLRPRTGAGIAVVGPGRPGEGDAGLAELLDPRVGWFALQLLVAFGLVAAWRARRLGRPVSEEQPVDVPASELVRAHGRLLHDRQASVHAGRVIRDGLCRRLAPRLGLPAATPAAELADAITQRTSVDPATVHQALLAPLGPDEADLVRLARAVQHLEDALAAPGAQPAQPARPDEPGQPAAPAPQPARPAELGQRR